MATILHAYFQNLWAKNQMHQNMKDPESYRLQYHSDTNDFCLCSFRWFSTKITQSETREQQGCNIPPDPESWNKKRAGIAIWTFQLRNCLIWLTYLTCVGICQWVGRGISVLAHEKYGIAHTLLATKSFLWSSHMSEYGHQWVYIESKGVSKGCALNIPVKHQQYWTTTKAMS